ncbi:MAG: NifB/NifX family molybdenum-iron cluster-binding protein [Bacteroidota bacterium]
MKIAVTNQNKKTINGHAGKTSRFLIYSIENNEIIEKSLLELAKEDLLHTRFHESPNPWAPHPIYDVDIIITGSAGMGFVNRLSRVNTQVIITPESNPDTAVKLLLEGNLPAQAPAHHHHQ